MSRWVSAVPSLLFLLAFAPACGGADGSGGGGGQTRPCDRYVDYMCACHADDTGFDCAELEAVYEKADADVQNSCALELSNQKEEDQEAGLDCEA